MVKRSVPEKPFDEPTTINPDDWEQVERRLREANSARDTVNFHKKMGSFEKAQGYPDPDYIDRWLRRQTAGKVTMRWWERLLRLFR